MRKALSGPRVIALVFVSALADSASAANDIYVGDKSSGCKVFRPNVQANESVAWTGKCLGDMADGLGTAQWSIAGKPTLSFSGTFKSGRLQGKGTMSAAGGDRYEGEYKDGMRDGKGIYVAASGERYEGAYKNNQRDGPGVLTDAQGRRAEGVFQSGMLVSQQSAVKSVIAVPSLGSTKIQTASPAASSTSTSTSAASPKIGQETKTASGTLFRIDSCSGLFAGVVFAVPPKSLDLKSSTPSKQYSAAEATGGIFTSVGEAVDIYVNVCKKGHGLRPSYVYFFPNGLPSPEGFSKATADPSLYVKVTPSGVDSWQVSNGPSNLFQQEERERREWTSAMQKKAQAKTQQDERVAKLTAFLKQHGAVEIPKMGILRSNPFSLEGKTVAITVNFYQMTGPTTGRFEVLIRSLDDQGGTVMVSDIPKGTFLEPTRAFLAAKVVGLTPVQGIEGGNPHLKYVGVIICSSQNTSCP